MVPTEVIKAKRDGKTIDEKALQSFVKSYVRGDVPDYQMAAFLMATYLNGMTRDEILALTKAYVESGRRLDFSDLGAPTVDKHSTGGVGDKVSIMVAPMVASCGALVPMISGRSLGHTGGTLDKLESIPGLRTNLTSRECKRILKRVGMFIAAQTDEMVPADKKIYALRNATGTIESIPLIVASIISKKVAEGAQSLVLDVKFGNGAFMKTARQARKLARELVAVGNSYGLNTAALLTDMNQPLGIAVGNALEVKEAISCLRGEGCPKDLMDVTLAVGALMLKLSGVTKSVVDGKRMLVGSINSGRALERFAHWIDAQGGNPKVVENLGLLPKAPVVTVVKSDASGWVDDIDTYRLGMLAVKLGAGTLELDGEVDHAVGMRILVKRGDRIEKDEILAEVHARSKSDAKFAEKEILESILIAEEPTRPRKPIMNAITQYGERRFLWGLDII